MTYWESVVFVLQGLAYAVAFFAVVVTILMVCAVIGTLWDNWPRFTAFLGVLLLVFGLPFLISRMTTEPEREWPSRYEQSVHGKLIKETDDSCRYEFKDLYSNAIRWFDLPKPWPETECEKTRTWYPEIFPVGD
jgi:hypothetical protein